MSAFLGIDSTLPGDDARIVKGTISHSTYYRIHRAILEFTEARSFVTVSFSQSLGPRNGKELLRCVQRVQRILKIKFKAKGIRVIEFKITKHLGKKYVFPHVHLVIDKMIERRLLEAELLRVFPWLNEGTLKRFRGLDFGKLDDRSQAAGYMAKLSTKAVPAKFEGITRTMARFGFPRDSPPSSRQRARVRITRRAKHDFLDRNWP